MGNSPRENLKHLKVLIKLAVLCSTGNKRGLRELFASPGFLRVPIKKVEEALLEVHLFAGFPATIEAFIELRRTVRLKKSREKPVWRDSRQRRLAQGRRTCQRVYGSNYDRLVKRMSTLHVDLARWILEDGYGKVLSRSGLTLVERETVAIAVLSANGWNRQLKSHIRGLAGLINASMQKRILQLIGPGLEKSANTTIGDGLGL